MPESYLIIEASSKRLRQLGFVEGGNLEIKRYSGEGHSERFGDIGQRPNGHVPFGGFGTAS